MKYTVNSAGGGTNNEKRFFLWRKLHAPRFTLHERGGAAALELLIALAVLVFSVSASITLVFGNQSVSVDAETNSEALLLAEQILEDARANARAGFNSIVSTAGVESLYGTELQVSDISQCKKEVASVVSWHASPVREQTVSLSTVLADVTGAVALGSDCDVSGPASGWENPTTLGSVDLDPAGVKATGVDAQNKIIFMSADAGSDEKPDLYIIDVTDEDNLALTIDAPDNGLDISAGAFGIDVVGDYAYIATDVAAGQLQVVDVSDIAHPALIAARSLPGVDPAGSYPDGRSIYYYDSKIYVGTHRTAGNEFHVYSVSDPGDPIHLGSIELDHNVNQIIVRNEVVSGNPKTLAYLATSSDTEELMVLDVTDPVSISQFGSFDAQTTLGGPSDEDGTALYLIGSRLYLGRERATSANERDFYILDVSDPSAPIVLGSKDLDLKPNTEVAGIAVSGPLAFIATTDSTAGFQAWHVSDPLNIVAPSACNIYNYSEKATDLDYSDGRVYVSNESNNALRIIWDDSSASCS